MTNARDMDLGSLTDRLDRLKDEMRNSITSFVNDTSVQIRDIDIYFDSRKEIGGREDYILNNIDITIHLSGSL